MTTPFRLVEWLLYVHFAAMSWRCQRKMVVGSQDCRETPKELPAELLSLLGQPPVLIVREPESPTTKLFS